MPARLPLPALVLLAALGACGDEPPPPPELTEGEVHFLVFNRLQGFAEGAPCNPDDVPPLPAAAAARDQLEAQGLTAALVLVGDTLLPATALTDFRPIEVAVRARADVLLEALAAARPAFWVPGPTDLRGEHFPRVVRRCEELGIPVLMSNVSAPTQPGIQSFVILEDGNLRVGCLGLLPGRVVDLTAVAQRKEGEERLAAPEFAEASVLPAAEAVERLAAELREQHGVHLVVAFSNLGAKANAALGGGLDVVFGSTDATTGIEAMVVENDVARLSSRPEGAELAHVMLRIAEGGTRLTDLGPMHTLPAQIAEDEAELQELFARHGTNDLAELATRAAPQDPQAFLRSAGHIDDNRQALIDYANHTGSALDHYAEPLQRPAPGGAVETLLARQGAAIEAAFASADLKPPAPLAPTPIPAPDTCVSCHPAQTAFWRGTAHAGAWDALAAGQRQHDPACLKCHATGYEHKLGWLDPRDDAPLGGVSCWSCHRTVAQHANKAWRVVDPDFQGWPTAFGMTCETCHTPERSPGFDRAAVLPQVSCPPMRADDPPLLLARQAALDAIAERRAAGESDERDAYLEARALIGLGRTDEGYPLLDQVIAANTSSTARALEIARLCDEHGDSRRALESLRTYLSHQTGDEAANWAYADLLLHARDPDARDPEQCARHLALLLPPDPRAQGPSFIDLRCLQIEALFAIGQGQEGAALLDALLLDHPEDARLLALRLRLTGR